MINSFPILLAWASVTLIERQPDTHFNFYDTCIIKYDEIPSEVRDELVISPRNIVTLETVRGQTPIHIDTSPRKAHTIWQLTDAPTTVFQFNTDNTEKTVLNKGDGMVINSQTKHQGLVENGKIASFLAIDYGDDMVETTRILDMIYRGIPHQVTKTIMMPRHLL
jgi:hypothetical protein